MPNTVDQVNVSDEIDRRDRRFRVFGVLLSVLAHFLFVALLFLPEARMSAPDQSPPPIEVDIVPAERFKSPEPEPPKPEPPKPEPPKPSAPQMDKPPETALPPPPPPQLVKARVAKTSSAPPRQGDPGDARPRSEDPPKPAPRGAVALSFAPQGAPDATSLVQAADGVPLRQSEEDFVLAQILKYWRLNFHPSESPDGVLTAVIFIGRDGTLAAPMHKDSPWNPGAVIPNYQDLARMGVSYKRDVLEGFYLALRLCQPLELPGVDTARWPKRLVVRFNLKDVWQNTGNRR